MFNGSKLKVKMVGRRGFALNPFLYSTRAVQLPPEIGPCVGPSIPFSFNYKVQSIALCIGPVFIICDYR